MNNLSVIIPSKTITNLIPCLEAVRKNEPDLRIIIVDDGIQWRDVEDEPGRNTAIIRGERPFIFARNVNLGIKAAGDDDVIVLNDDALLTDDHGFSNMRAVANWSRSLWGLVSASTNSAGNLQQRRQHGGALREVTKLPGHSAPVVAFVCVFIPRLTINRVGLLDPQFVAYGWEDNDYCRRVHKADLKVGVFDGCFVDHSKLRSTFRGAPGAAGDIEPGRKIYMEKWGSL